MRKTFLAVLIIVSYGDEHNMLEERAKREDILMTKVVIIGGSDAGISAALRAKEVDAQAEVSVIVADSFPNYCICGLPFYLSGEVPD